MKLLHAIHDVGPFFAFSPRIARAVGGPEEGLLLQFVLWKLPSLDDEVALTAIEIEEGTGLTQRRQERARRELRRLGVLVETLRGLPARLHYRIDAEWFDVLWTADRDAATPRDVPHNRRSTPEAGQDTGGDEIVRHATTERGTDESANLASTKARTLPQRKGDQCIDETSIHSSLEEHKEQAIDVAKRDADRRSRKSTKASAQSTLSMTIDAEDLIAGRHDKDTSDDVLAATVRLWASVWSDAPSRVVVTSARRRTWRETIKGGATPGDFARAILGMKHDTGGTIDRRDYCDFVHVARNLDRWCRLFAERGDPRGKDTERKRSTPSRLVRASSGKSYRVPIGYSWTSADENAASMGYEWDEDSATWKAPRR